MIPEITKGTILKRKASPQLVWVVSRRREWWNLSPGKYVYWGFRRNSVGVAFGREKLICDTTQLEHGEYLIMGPDDIVGGIL